MNKKKDTYSKIFEDVHRFRKITRNVSVWKIQICKCQNVLCMYVILFVWWHIYLKKEHERTFPNFYFHEKKSKNSDVHSIPKTSSFIISKTYEFDLHNNNTENHRHQFQYRLKSINLLPISDVFWVPKIRGFSSTRNQSLK